MEKISKKNICLVGLMGSGKTHVGKILSKELGLRFIDTDILIEKKMNMTINAIFKEYGEKYFRNIEEKIVNSELVKTNSIVSLGGGSILSDLTRKNLKKYCYTIFLNINIEILYNRIKNSKKRPLIIKENIKKTLSNLLSQRMKYYKEADLIINQSNSEKIIEKIKKSIHL